MSSDQLRTTIGNLYDVFSTYSPTAVSTHASHTTITEDDVRKLRSRPLRELSGRDLSKYSMKGLTTWGDENEFRHYLPRLLELVVSEPGWTDVPTLLGKLLTGRWREWPKPEQEAIEEFVRAAWIATLAGETRVSLANVALGASNAGIPIARLVDAWEKSTGVASVLQLANLITLERNELLRDGSLGRRWSDEARNALNALIRSEQMRTRMEETFLTLNDSMQTHAVSDALGTLEMLPPGT